MNKEKNENSGFVVNVYSSGNQLIHSQVNNYYGTVCQGGTKIGNLVLDNHGTMTLSATVADDMQEKEEKADTPLEQGKEAIMEYVDRLKPLIRHEYQERYDEIWMGILELKEVREEVYDKGKQQDTTFNRNLVAQIFHMMAEKICAPTIKVAHMAERLEPDKGVDHPVRKKLAEAPKKGIKKSVENYLLENL